MSSQGRPVGRSGTLCALSGQSSGIHWWLSLRTFQKLLSIVCLFFLATPCFAVEPGSAQTVVREDNPPSSAELNIPIYEWHEPGNVAPRAVLLFIHGTSLHGAVYDVVARELASQGYIVYAPDMRGFGRWLSEPDKYEPSNKISGFETRADLIKLLCIIHRDHPGVPVYSLGESLGANLSLWIASVAPDLIDGIVMSSPCIQRRSTREEFCSTMVFDFLKFWVMPNRPMALAPYARRFLSERKDVIDAYIQDPLMRKSITAFESFKSLHTNRSCLWFADHVPASMPILVFKGTNDRMMNQTPTPAFMKRVNVNDYTMVELEGKGHIQLETPYISDYVENRLTDWLNTHTDKARNLVSHNGGSDADKVGSKGSGSMKSRAIKSEAIEPDAPKTFELATTTRLRAE
jgi:alpha-beta hydrolase superfamily lysophospholipase